MRYLLSCIIDQAFCSPRETATTAMGAHIFPFGPQAIQQGQGKIRACYSCAAIEGATRGGCMTRCADCEESEVWRTHNTVWTALDNLFKFHLCLNGVPALLRTLFRHIPGQRTSYCSGNGVPIAVSSPLVRIHTPEALSERIITSNTLLISLINSLTSPSPHTVNNSICKIYCA